MVTKKQCIDKLVSLADEHGRITREHFRDASGIEEKEWRKYFGTFTQFKREAGIKVSRHARQLETDIARHVSVEKYKGMNADKQSWGEEYLKPTNKKYQTILVGSDIHDIECDPFWRMLFLDTALRVQPERVVLNGDIFDLPEFGKYSVDPREWDVVGRIQWVHKFLAELRAAVPDAQIDFIEGNHEYRLLRHLAEATPAMKAILADLHGWTVPKLLGLDKFEVNYIAPADLATFNKEDAKAELRRNFLIINDFLVAHHFPEGNQYGLPGWNGHHHTHEVITKYSPLHGSYEWHQLGAGHKREASYCNGEKWGNGFLLVHADVQAKRAQFEYIDTSSNHCVIGGKWYTRGKA